MYMSMYFLLGFFALYSSLQKDVEYFCISLFVLYTFSLFINSLIVLFVFLFFLGLGNIVLIFSLLLYI